MARPKAANQTATGQRRRRACSVGCKVGTSSSALSDVRPRRAPQSEPRSTGSKTSALPRRTSSRWVRANSFPARWTGSRSRAPAAALSPGAAAGPLMPTAPSRPQRRWRRGSGIDARRLVGAAQLGRGGVPAANSAPAPLAGAGWTGPAPHAGPAGDDDAGRRAVGGLGGALRAYGFGAPRYGVKPTVMPKPTRRLSAETSQPEKDPREMTFDFGALPPRDQLRRACTPVRARGR